MELNVIFYLLTNLISGIYCFSSNGAKDAVKSIRLPPCAACRVFTESFNKGIKDTARGKFEGGDSSWEEENKKSYKNSEVRLVEIQEKLCLEVSRGQSQCQNYSEIYESHIEDWWINHQESEPDFYVWLCIKELKVCCPPSHYGPSCSPCKGGSENPCNGNGKCKGEGTRKGNGECECNKGYAGKVCTQCAVGYYEAYRDGQKLLCEACHESCDGPCTQAGPKSCVRCKSGWTMDTEEGCLDVNECRAAEQPCKKKEFCYNTQGSYSCNKCDKSCNQCLGQGPDVCINCAEGYESKEGICVDKSMEEREQNVVFARYVTYAGLTVAPCILLQRHTVMAAVIGLIVASYISFSEYYLTYMQGESANAKGF